MRKIKPIIFFISLCILAPVFSLEYQSTENKGMNKVERMNYIDRYLVSLNQEVIKMKDEILGIKNLLEKLQNSSSIQNSRTDPTLDVGVIKSKVEILERKVALLSEANEVKVEDSKKEQSGKIK